MSFDSEISQGRFCIPECAVCKRVQWPPAEFCSRCFSPTRLKEGDFAGIVMEYGGYNGRYFCLVEFEGAVRVMAGMEKLPRIDQQVKISECGIKDGRYFFSVA